MTAGTEPLTKCPAWKALETHNKAIRGLHLRKLFADDPKRGERMTAEAAGIYLDYSKNRITDETILLLLQLAEECGLRAPKGASIVVDGQNVVPQVHAVRDRMSDFSNRVRSGEWKGHTGKRIRN